MNTAVSPAFMSFAREDVERPSLRGVGSAASETGTTNVRILGVNDLHGNLAPPPRVGDRHAGGVAYLDAHMDRYERARPGRTIRVHAGDMVGGSPLASSRFHDEPTVLAMNEMGFDVGTLGNHEFDDGGEEMMRLVDGGRGIGDAIPLGGPGTFDPAFSGAAFPYLAANTVYAGSGEPVLPPYAVVERGGVRIGFVGVTTRNTPKGLMPETAALYRFLDISETVNRYVAELRGRGVEAIVVLAHAGGTAGPPPQGEVFLEAAEMSGAVDVVVAGHSHTVLDERVGDTLVVQAEEYGRAFSVIDLEIDRRTGDVAKSRAGILPTSHGEVQPDETLSALVSRYEERVASVSGRVVAEAADDVTREPNAFGESALSDLVADAQRSFAGADFAFVNSAALRTDIQAGPVTYGELFAVQPFGADVVRLDLPGSAVLRLLEQQHSDDGTAVLQVSGLSYSPDASAPEGRRVTEVTLEDGTALDPDATYSVAADSFLASGGGYSVFREGTNRRVAGGDVEALVSHLEGLEQPFVAPAPDGRPDRKAADEVAKRLRSDGYKPRVVRVSERAPDDPARGPLGYLVRTGSFATQAEADALRARLTADGYQGTRTVYTGEDGRRTTGPWVVHVLEVDPGLYGGDVAPELATEVVPERELLTSISARNDSLAAINGGYFVIEPKDGTPGDLAGISVLEGDLVSEAVDGRTSLLLPEGDGEGADVAALSDTITASSSDGARREVDGKNRKPGLIRGCGGDGGDSPTERPKHDFTCTDESELILFTPIFGAATEPGAGTEAVLDSSGRVTALREGRGGPIPPNGSVLSGTGEGARWLRAHARSGATVAVETNVEADGATLAGERTGVVNGGPRLLANGKPEITAFAEGFVYPEDPEFYYRFGVRRNPRTLAGVTSEGNLLLVAVDGRRPGYSVGTSFEESARVIDALGAEEAVNLDGGGSTAVTVGERLRNRPSDATGERPIGDAVVLLP